MIEKPEQMDPSLLLAMEKNLLEKLKKQVKDIDIKEGNTEPETPSKTPEA